MSETGVIRVSIKPMTSSTGSSSPPKAKQSSLSWAIGPAIGVASYLALAPRGLGRWAGAALVVNFAWALVDRDRAFLHDRIAGTKVVNA